MRNTIKSLNPRLFAYRRPALIAAVSAVALGLAVAGLLNARAQSPSRQTAEQARSSAAQPQMVADAAPQAIAVNWPKEARRFANYDDYLLSFRRDDKMYARVVTTRSPENGSPQGIIVIYDGNGHILACIGRAKACKELVA